MGSRLGLTEQGKQWLIAAVDPFHDTPVQCVGYPDVNEAASVVQVVKMSQGLVAPSDLAGANWDCHIHQFPWMQPSFEQAGNWSNTTNNDQSTGYGSFLLGTGPTQPGGGSNTTSPAFGGLAVSYAASGTNTFVWQSPTAHNSVPFATQLQPYLVGEYRIIGMGFEVINTTSELNIQGLVTCYRQPMMSIDASKSVLVSTGAQLTGSNGNFKFSFPDVAVTANPPALATSALLLDGSKQWKAKEGCYVVSTLNSDEIPAGVNNTTPICLTDPADGYPNANNFRWGMVVPINPPSASWLQQTFALAAGTETIGAFPTGSSFMSAFNHSGAFFSGLSPTTTLQLNAIYYIERFPTQLDSDLVVLAKHSCRADCIARELYSEIIREMPVGVPQRMNGLGEWFSDAVSSAANFISPVLSAIPHPMAQAAGAGIKTVGGIAKAIMGKKEAPGQTYSPAGGNVSTGSKLKALVASVGQKKKKVAKKK